MERLDSTLISASRASDAAVVRRLIARGADVNSHSSVSRHIGAIHVACYHGSLECAAALLAGGAVLRTATRSCSADISALLHSQSADSGFNPHLFHKLMRCPVRVPSHVSCVRMLTTLATGCPDSLFAVRVFRRRAGRGEALARRAVEVSLSWLRDAAPGPPGQPLGLHRAVFQDLLAWLV